MSNTFCASAISAVAASFACVYAARLSAVLPVGVSSPVNPSNAVLACVKPSLLAGSFSVAAASASLALIAFTFSWAFNASTSLALAPLSATSLAACLAASSSADN